MLSFEVLLALTLPNKTAQHKTRSPRWCFGFSLSTLRPTARSGFRWSGLVLSAAPLPKRKRMLRCCLLFPPSPGGGQSGQTFHIEERLSVSVRSKVRPRLLTGICRRNPPWLDTQHGGYIVTSLSLTFLDGAHDPLILANYCLPSQRSTNCTSNQRRPQEATNTTHWRLKLPVVAAWHLGGANITAWVNL